jgi:hypothetical protein
VAFDTLAHFIIPRLRSGDENGIVLGRSVQPSPR